jgi:hypothetical protein
MTCFPRIAPLGGWILLLLHAAPLPVAALDIKLADSLPAPGNNLVQLRPIDANPAPAEPATDVKKYLNIARTEDSRYTVVLKNIEHAGANQYFTYEFLVWRNSGNRDTTQVLFNVTSTGSFADFFKDVPFKVIDGANQAPGSINIPVRSLDPAPVCKAVAIPTRTSPLQVFLSGDTEFTISLNCSDAASVPKLVNLSGPYGHGAYWKRLGYESQYYGPSGPSKPLAAKSFDLLKATLTPNVLAAVGARFRRFSIKDSPDDTIVFDLAYAIQPAGLEIPMKIEIPIAFYPYISVIAGSLSLGVLIGWIGLMLLMWVAGKSKPVKTTIGAFFLGLFLAVPAFALVLLAYSANCRLTLFGVEVNPSDVLVLFALGLICGCVAMLKAEELQKLLDQILDRIRPGGAPAGGLFVLLLAGLLCAPVSAAGGQLALVGLSACPDGDVIGLHKDGTVIQFSGASRGAWKRSGRLSSNFNAAELTCATVDGKKTAFVVAMALQRIWVVRMDVATGRWSETLVANGISAGIAFDPASNRVFLSSIKERAIYYVSSMLKDPGQWASIFGRAESIGALAVDSAGKRLLVGEAFSGIVYSLDLDSRRQGTMAEGMGSVNSLSVDRRRNLLYIADAGRRAIWVVPLAGEGPKRPKVFYRSDELKTVSGVAADNQSNVWVGVYTPGKVIVLGPDGKQLGVIE